MVQARGRRAREVVARRRGVVGLEGNWLVGNSMSDWLCFGCSGRGVAEKGRSYGNGEGEGKPTLRQNG